MEMSWISTFSARNIRVEMNAANNMFLTIPSQSFKPVSWIALWCGLSVISGTNVVSDVSAQPTSDKGISSAVMARAYFRVPGLTTPQRNWKRYGRSCDTSLDTQSDTQTTSTQVKNHLIGTPPIIAPRAVVAPMTIGTASIMTKGAM